MKYVIYTDGGCDKNPGGKGGIGVYVVDEDRNETEISKSWSPTTNNRMEMRAILYGINCMKEGDEAVIFSDSQYVIKCITGEFKKKKNLDLWAEIDKAMEGKILHFEWVKGHDGNPLNEKVDQMATNAIKNLPADADEGYANGGTPKDKDSILDAAFEKMGK